MNKKVNSKIIFYIINIFIIILVSGLTIYKIVKENGVETFSHIKNISLISLLVLTTIYFINNYLDGVVIALAVKEYKKDFSASEGFVINSVGGLFSAITPLKVGYLPAIGYAYSRFNVDAETVIKSMAKTSYTYQIWCLLISVISLIVCCNKEMIVELGEVSLNLKHVAIIGVVYNSFLMIGYLILVLSPQIHGLVINVLSWILFKLKKINNREEYIESKKYKMSLIRKEIIGYFKNLKYFFKMFFIYVIKSTSYSSLPYFVFLLVSKQGFDVEIWLYSIVLNTLISYVSSIVPIPGASGAAEIVFIAVFSLIFFPNSLLNSIMLIW